MSNSNILSVFLLLNLFPLICQAEDLVIHEWGTFTSLQDEAGKSVAGINVDDEPVPNFVHRVKDQYYVEHLNDRPVIWSQGAPACNRNVTMRLETPVIYFYGNSTLLRPFDVAVEFPGGWITEFYPLGDNDAPGFPTELSSSKTGVLRWQKLSLTDEQPTPHTTEHVWLTPRNVKSNSVKTLSAGFSEIEKYLFYRGVANLDSPLQVSRQQDDFLFVSQIASPLILNQLWLVDIRNDETAAFRSVGSFNSQNGTIKSKANFNDREFKKDNISILRTEMHKALVEEGLYEEEATAMLDTWELSYFKSPGLRVFFIAPRSWVDSVLPIKISLPAQLKRIMVGRIELITPEQRAVLKRLANEHIDFEMMTKSYHDLFKNLPVPSTESNNSFQKISESRLSDLPEKFKAQIPKLYNDYLALGKFRSALLLDEYRQRPTNILNEFIHQAACY